MTEKSHETEEVASELSPLAKKLSGIKDLKQKFNILKNRPEIPAFFSKHPKVEESVQRLSEDKQLTIFALIILGEGEIVFQDFNHGTHNSELLDELAEQLLRVENFYDTIGGIIGYHLAFVKLLKEAADDSCGSAAYESPKSFDIRQNDLENRQAVLTGLKNLPQTGMIFPVGGAGDRLDLHDDITDVPLPAAKLPFAGRSLLGGMFRDIQGLEYLYYKVFGSRITIPVALMTSFEKENDHHIHEICRENQWFHRDPEMVMTFTQPMTPVITKEGRWSFKAPLKLNLKPGGHGVIWKLAIDHGIFQAFRKKGVRKTLMRQVNNPLAGIDGNFLTLMGYGFRDDRLFGFMTCDRPVHISEGMVVLEARDCQDHFEYCLKNIEYTEFVKMGIEDQPCHPGSQYSIFPSNTNILFADLDAVTDAIEKNPLPGMLINLKAQFPTLQKNGEIKDMYGGRLETVMQSVADHFVISSDRKLSEKEKQQLPAFSLYNTRQKTHSTTKRTFKAGTYEDQTPVRSYYDLQSTYCTLLSDFCGIDLPQAGSFEDYLERGLPIVCDFHPALGPLFDVIGQKIRKGRIQKGSELQLEIAEIDVENIQLEGSLRVVCDSPLGDEGHEGGKCVLIDVAVQNEGARLPGAEYCWKGQFQRSESLEIFIHGCGEFYAKGVTFRGTKWIEVPDGCRVVAKEVDGDVALEVHPIEKPSWSWNYTLDNESRIILKK